jgi:hypothetical protein
MQLYESDNAIYRKDDNELLGEWQDGRFLPSNLLLTMEYAEHQLVEDFAKVNRTCRCGKPALFRVIATNQKVCNLHRPDGFVCQRLPK